MIFIFNNNNNSNNNCLIFKNKLPFIFKKLNSLLIFNFLPFQFESIIYFNFYNFILNFVILFFLFYCFYYCLFFIILKLKIKKLLKSVPIIVNSTEINKTKKLEQELQNLNPNFDFNNLTLEEKYNLLLEFTLNLSNYTSQTEQKAQFGLEILAVLINKTTKYKADQIYNFFIPKFLATNDPIEKKEILELILKILLEN